MRKILLSCTVLLQIFICNGQPPCPFPDINYNGYYEVFSDNFNYNPSTFKTDPAFTSKWIIPPTGLCVGHATSVVDPGNITMPISGRIKFTEYAVSLPSCAGKDHKSGWLHSSLPYYVDFGIIEASLQLPPHINGENMSAFPTFWIPNYHADPTWTWQQIDDSVRRNEIDILDNDQSNETASWTKFYTYCTPQLSSAVLQAANETTMQTPCFPGPVNLSTNFHRFSCVWTPSRIIFYIDQHYLKHYDFDGNQGAMQVARTVGQIHSLIIALQTKPATQSNLSMYVEWVRYLALKCNPGTFLANSANLSNYPYLPPDYVTNYSSNFNMLKYSNIVINDNSPSSPIRTKNTLATILEAEATIIEPNFLADQSMPIWGASYTTNNTTIPIPMNGYLDIRPKRCEQRPEAGIGWADDGGNGPAGRSAAEFDELGLSNIASREPNVYPNPNDGKFVIELPNKDIYEIRIVNLLGKTVYEMQLKDTLKWDLQLNSALPAGNYFIHIIGKSQNHIKKLTISR